MLEPNDGSTSVHATHLRRQTTPMQITIQHTATPALATATSAVISARYKQNT